MYRVSDAAKLFGVSSMTIKGGDIFSVYFSENVNKPAGIAVSIPMTLRYWRSSVNSEAQIEHLMIFALLWKLGRVA
jgi:hypothetical protein